MKRIYLILAFTILLPFMFLQTSEAKLRYEETKGFGIVDGKTFKNRQGNTIDLGVANPIQAIPFYNLIRNYMDFPAVDDNHAAMQTFAKALFRQIRPQDTAEAQAGAVSNKISYYFTGDMVGSLVAAYLLEDPNNDLELKPGSKIGKKQIDQRKIDLAIKFFVGRSDFKEQLSQEHQLVCNDKTYNSPALSMSKREAICSISNLEEAAGAEIYPLLSSNFRSNINQVLNIFASKPDLVKIKLLLGVMWSKFDKKVDFWDYFSALDTALANENIDFLPKDKEVWLDLEWDYDEVTGTEYAIKESDYSKLVVKALVSSRGQPTLLQEDTEVNYDVRWFDCCARSIKNFVMLTFSEENSDPVNVNFNTKKLSRVGAAQSVVEYFTIYNDRNSLDDQQARNDWGKIQSNIPGVAYKTGGELAPGRDNLFKVLLALFFENAKSKPKDWEELVKAIDPEGSVEEASDVELNFNMSGYSFAWTTSDIHFGIDFRTGAHGFNLWPLLEDKKEIQQSIVETSSLAASDKVRWLELAQRLDPNATENIVFNSKNNQKYFYYLLSLSTGEQVERAIGKIGSSETAMFDYLMSRAAANPDVFRRVMETLSRGDDEEKLTIGTENFIDLEFPGFVGRGAVTMTEPHLVMTTVNSTANAKIWKIVAEKIGTFKKLRNLKFTIMLDNSLSIMDPKPNNGYTNEKFLDEFYKNLPDNKSLTSLTVDVKKAAFPAKNVMSDEYNKLVQDSWVNLIKNNKSINSVKISEGFPITNEILAAIGGLPLVNLQLEHIPLSSSQFEQLITALKDKTRLETLVIAEAGLTDENIKYLDDELLSESKGIRVIDVRGNADITEAGVDILEKRYLENDRIDRIGVKGSYSRYSIASDWTDLSSQEPGQGMTRRRQVWSPYRNGFTYMGFYRSTRSYSTSAYQGPIRTTRPVYQAFRNRPNVTYGRPLFIYTQNRQFLTAMPNSLIRMQPAQPVLFTQNGLIPWNAPKFPSVWTNSNWKQFVSRFKYLVK